MMFLKDILYGVRLKAVTGSTAIEISKVQFDSRKVTGDDLFVAIKGGTVDGHTFIEQVIEAGAIAIVCEEFPEKLQEKVTYIQVDNSKNALAVIAANYHDNPSKDLKLIGVTGTNGKTTVSTLLYDLFKKAGYKVGLISTIKIMVDDQQYETSHTTPDPMTINHHLHLMAEEGVEFCFMEVSSHGLDQHRTAGLRFNGAIFTNLSHDHLDYHKDFASYRDTKKRLFDDLEKSGFALSNIDDKNGLFMIQNTRAKKYTYALKTFADFRGQIMERQFDGQLLKIDENDLWTKLIGDFN
ncbi:MAG: UDP-N-acetylmuramoyl-L-alanyl-D-glutamate--2,6-diaminopimelate ligase, partial [Eudoraea sp.]|nr:UDP-N-acetylmuramoyl-L-alanyl-D-glutamate--2,6-diaminopimelate ligase [Eudoraea sp.]